MIASSMKTIHACYQYTVRGKASVNNCQERKRKKTGLHHHAAIKVHDLLIPSILRAVLLFLSQKGAGRLKKFQKRATSVIKIVKLLLYDEQQEGERNSLKTGTTKWGAGEALRSHFMNNERHWRRDQQHTPGRGMGHWQMKAVGGRFS